MRECEHECYPAEYGAIKLSSVGSVVLTVMDKGKQQDVALIKV